jgi:hypothetical protein
LQVGLAPDARFQIRVILSEAKDLSSQPLLVVSVDVGGSHYLLDKHYEYATISLVENHVPTKIPKSKQKPFRRHPVAAIATQIAGLSAQ